MKIRIIVALIFAMIIGFVAGGGSEAYFEANPIQLGQEKTTVTAPVTPVVPPNVYELWQLTNQQRVSAGLEPLALDPGLDASAETKCNDMVKRNYWDHTDPEGNMPWQLIKEYYGTYRGVSENLAEGQTTSANVVTQWVASPEHKQNLLNTHYTDTGLAVCRSDNFLATKAPAYVIVQHFAYR